MRQVWPDNIGTKRRKAVFNDCHIERTSRTRKLQRNNRMSETRDDVQTVEQLGSIRLPRFAPAYVEIDPLSVVVCFILGK